MDDELSKVIVSVYPSLSTGSLRKLRAAFAIDRDLATSDESRAFCDGRIALIDDALARRNVAVRSIDVDND